MKWIYGIGFHLPRHGLSCEFWGENLVGANPYQVDYALKIPIYRSMQVSLSGRRDFYCACGKHYGSIMHPG